MVRMNDFTHPAPPAAMSGWDEPYGSVEQRPHREPLATRLVIELEPTAPESRRADTSVSADVRRRLRERPELDPRRVGVMVLDGKVTLSGTVSLPAHRRVAETTARGVAGVRRIVNRLKIEAAPTHKAGL